MNAPSLANPHFCFQAPAPKKDGPMQISLKDLLNVKLKKTGSNLRTDKVNWRMDGYMDDGASRQTPPWNPCISWNTYLSPAKHFSLN